MASAYEQQIEPEVGGLVDDADVTMAEGPEDSFVNAGAATDTAAADRMFVAVGDIREYEFGALLDYIGASLRWVGVETREKLEGVG